DQLLRALWRATVGSQRANRHLGVRPPGVPGRREEQYVIMRHFAFLSGCVLAAAGCGGDKSAGGTAATPRAENQQSFKGKQEFGEGLELLGPSAKEHVRLDGSGLRVSLPLNHAFEKPTGVATGVGVSGDFEITVSYELLGEPEPADVGKIGTRLS